MSWAAAIAKAHHAKWCKICWRLVSKDNAKRYPNADVYHMKCLMKKTEELRNDNLDRV